MAHIFLMILFSLLTRKFYNTLKSHYGQLQVQALVNIFGIPNLRTHHETFALSFVLRFVINWGNVLANILYWYKYTYWQEIKNYVKPVFEITILCFYAFVCIDLFYRYHYSIPAISSTQIACDAIVYNIYSNLIIFT